MPNSILLEEFHVSLFLPTKLSDSAERAILRTLRSAHFNARLAGAVHAVLRHYPALQKIQFRISR